MTRRNDDELRAPMTAIALGVAVLMVGVLDGWSAPSGASVATPTRSATLSVAPRVIHAPIGYEMSSGSGATNGPVSPAAFDSWIGQGSTAAYGYVSGNDVTYDNTATNESIEVTVFSFRSHADAAAFASAAMTGWGAASLAPEVKTIRAIRGSTVQLATKAGSDGFYLVDAFARKGDKVMLVEDANTVKPKAVLRPSSPPRWREYALLSVLRLRSGQVQRAASRHNAPRGKRRSRREALCTLS